jgi:hypothetical protein
MNLNKKSKTYGISKGKPLVKKKRAKAKLSGLTRKKKGAGY